VTYRITIPLAPRGSAIAERCEDLARPKREIRERSRGAGQRPPVPDRIGDEENHVIDLAVAPLQRQPTLQRLDVIEHRFRFDGQVPIGPADHRIPGAEVALDRQWHLGGPSQARMEPRPQSPEEPRLAGVPDRVPGRVGSEADLQANHGAEGSDVLVREFAKRAAFEAPDSGVVDSGCLANGTEAEPGADPRSPDIRRDDLNVRPHAPPASLAWALARAHRTRWWTSVIACGLSGQPIVLLWAPQATTEFLMCAGRPLDTRPLLLADPQAKAELQELGPEPLAGHRLWGLAQHGPGRAGVAMLR